MTIENEIDNRMIQFGISQEPEVEFKKVFFHRKDKNRFV